MSSREAPLGVGLIGCGTIGNVLAHAIDEGEAGYTRLVMIYDRVPQKSRELASELSAEPEIAGSFARLASCSDIRLVIEAASQDAVREYALAVLQADKDLIIMSVGALVDSELIDAIRDSAERLGRKAYVPSGAIAGLDGLKSAAVDRLDEVTLTTRKPPSSLKDVVYLRRRGINIDSLTKPKTVYEGSALDACKLFPANVNVAAALSLAGVGTEKTKVQIVADPTTKRNIHQIRVRGKFGELTVRIENTPSAKHPETSYLAALSAVATLRKVTQHVSVGT